MIISIICVMDKKRGIGKNNKLPWDVPADLNFFKKKTLGKPIIMGWNTFLSIDSRPLPDRFNIVISRDENISVPEGVYLVGNPVAALELAKQALLEDNGSIDLNEDDEIMIIGGTSVYDVFVKYADRMYLTLLDLNADCDKFFPKFDESKWVGFMIESGVSNNVPYEIYQFNVS